MPTFCPENPCAVPYWLQAGFIPGFVPERSRPNPSPIWFLCRPPFSHPGFIPRFHTPGSYPGFIPRVPTVPQNGAVPHPLNKLGHHLHICIHIYRIRASCIHCVRVLDLRGHASRDTCAAGSARVWWHPLPSPAALPVGPPPRLVQPPPCHPFPSCAGESGAASKVRRRRKRVGKTEPCRKTGGK